MGNYSATVTVNGCESPPSELELEILKIKTFDDFDFPNVLTPNGDQVNDVYDIETYFQTCQEFTLYIFNRWGNVIYQQKNNETPFNGIGMDGNEVEDGVFFYRLDYEKGSKSGFFHVIR